MKIWEHADLCLSIGKINAYRKKSMNKEAIQWINELIGKLNDLKEYLEGKKLR